MDGLMFLTTENILIAAMKQQMTSSYQVAPEHSGIRVDNY